LQTRASPQQTAAWLHRQIRVADAIVNTHARSLSEQAREDAPRRSREATTTAATPAMVRESPLARRFRCRERAAPFRARRHSHAEASAARV
jgi:hypothetical protein